MTTPRIDDLQYDWPVDILRYESKYLLGLKLQDLLLVAIPGMIPMLFNKLALGVVGTVVGYLLVRKFEGLGDRNALAYGFARLQALAQEQTVTLPLILPAAQVETVIITDLDGNELARLGGHDTL